MSTSIKQLIDKVASIIGEDDSKLYVSNALGRLDTYEVEEFLQELDMDSAVPDNIQVGPILVLEHPFWCYLSKSSIVMSNLDTVLDSCSRMGLSVRDWILLNSPIPLLQRFVTPSMYPSIPAIRNQLLGRVHRYAQVVGAKELFGLCFDEEGWGVHEDQWPKIISYADSWVKDNFPGLQS